MVIEECNGNLNYMYEFRINNNWYPCHIIRKSGNLVRVFTRNGTIMTEHLEDVRKMTEIQYLKQRSDIIRYFGKFASSNGYHENIEEDLALFSKTLEVKDIE